jgi:hypothetical protein
VTRHQAALFSTRPVSVADVFLRDDQVAAAQENLTRPVHARRSRPLAAQTDDNSV